MGGRAGHLYASAGGVAIIMKFEKSLGMLMKAQRDAGKREPLRTLSELADEFGVSKWQFGRALAKPGAPQPVFDGQKRYNILRTKWFRPSEVRAWWKINYADLQKPKS